jgi:hypothetical protein
MVGRIAILALLAVFALDSAIAEQKPRPRPKRSSTQQGEALTYAWVDDRGVMQYGDRVPPEYANRELRVLNSQGVEVRRIQAQKTPQQQAEENRRAQLAARQAQHDKFLLSTYSSTRDIEQVRDSRLAQVDEQRRSTEAYLATLQERLASLQLQAQAFRPYNESPDARPMPDRLADELVRTLNETRSQKKLLDARRAEEEAVRAQFQADIERYRQLRAGLASAGR